MKQSTSAFLWILIISISTHLQCVFGEPQISVDSKPDSNTTMTMNETIVVQAAQQHSYIVRIKLTIRESSIIPYIRDEIFYRNYAYNITTEDLIDLFDVRDYGLNETMEKLQSLNVSENIFNVPNFKLLLEFVNMTYADFYEKLKTGSNMTGTPLREALEALNIDSSNYSLAIAYGPQDGIYDVLSKGIYTMETFRNATAKLGTDVESFYRHVSTILLDQIEENSLEYYGEKLKLILPWFTKKAYDDLWTVFDVDLFDVYLVPNVRKIIEDLYSRLDQNLTLGVSTSPHEIVIHRAVYQKLQNLLKLVNINAVVLVPPEKIYDDLTFKPEKGQNFATLYSNKSLTSSIEISKELTSINEPNCTYITINDTQIIENQVKIVNITQNSIIVAIENGTMFNVGNPLICKEKLVGLASTHNENNLFVFDAFYHSAEKVPTSGSHDGKILTIVLLQIIFLYTLRLIR